MITDVFSTLPMGTKFEINGLILGQGKHKSVRNIKRTEFEIGDSEILKNKQGQIQRKLTGNFK